MNYKFETIMSWIMYYKNKVWEVEGNNECVKDPRFIKDKFEDLFFNELVREFNDSRHLLTGLYDKIGTITVFINPEKVAFRAMDNYNVLLAIYNGIYGVFDGKRLCISTKEKGLKREGSSRNYFSFQETDSDDFVSVYSIVTGACKSGCPNVRRLISILFARQFQYLESINSETFMFMDYSAEEKEKIIEDCENYDKILNKKKSKKDVGPIEED